MRKKVLYLCDRGKCADCSYPICLHTEDINHAKNFKSIKLGAVGYIEKENAEMIEDNIKDTCIGACERCKSHDCSEACVPMLQERLKHITKELDSIGAILQTIKEKEEHANH